VGRASVDGPNYAGVAVPERRMALKVCVAWRTPAAARSASSKLASVCPWRAHAGPQHLGNDLGAAASSGAMVMIRNLPRPRGRNADTIERRFRDALDGVNAPPLQADERTLHMDPERLRRAGRRGAASPLRP
jgi:hypothetical protein